MPKVLITGANGFVGQHLAKELSDNGIETVGIGGQQGAAHPEHLSSYMALDLTQAENAAKIPFNEVDGVIHLAGLAAVGASFDDPMRYINTNVGIETNLFEAALAQHAKPRFLIISSGNLYDPSADLPLNEESDVKPSSPYAVSKLGQEQMAQYYHERGFECIVARPFNHIGPGQSPGFIVPDITKQVVEFQQGKQQKIMVGNLDAKRDYTDVRDIARAYRLLLDKGISGEIYNVCSGRALSGHEILAGILSAADCKPDIEQDPDKMRPSDNPVIFGDHAKLTDQTGWTPEIPLETTLRDAIGDWRTRA